MCEILNIYRISRLVKKSIKKLLFCVLIKITAGLAPFINV
ncbi:hypothetical protein CLOLEP_01333 [[Clostridium] leptum DSM 753]|uniref:Uncharacterized protein n=1 Tax=[Clostridium] leptum DSM 753 TaxID=428125 RepID=A7VRZ6_9FIRM|nr:hypothetical protein CLOLEP_01333 [[Clostridium] leptum DSM 753]